MAADDGRRYAVVIDKTDYTKVVVGVFNTPEAASNWAGAQTNISTWNDYNTVEVTSPEDFQ